MQQSKVIALVGNTGNSTRNHLHFEVREGGSKVDAMEFFKKKEKFRKNGDLYVGVLNSAFAIIRSIHLKSNLDAVSIGSVPNFV